MKTLLPDVTPTKLRDGYTLRVRRLKEARRPKGATRRIVDTYREALFVEDDDVARLWYYQARSWCEYRAAEYGRSVEVVAGVLAALSPGTTWEDNKRDTITVLEAAKATRASLHWMDWHELPRVRTYKANLRKALRILVDGEYPGNVLRKYAMESRRNKTWTFWYNIVKPYWRDKVTVDRHAIAVALGRPATQRERSMSNYKYRCYEAAYLEAARVLKVPAPMVQAVTWEHWRRKAQGE